MISRILTAFAFVFLTSCDQAANKPATAEFIENADKKLTIDYIADMRAGWLKSNFITLDTMAIAADYNARYSTTATNIAVESRKYKGNDKTQKRILELFPRVLTVPAPKDPALNLKLSNLKSELEGMYGSGKYCTSKNNCKDLEQLQTVTDNSRDPEKLLEAWEGWRQTSIPMKDKFQESVRLGNQGAKDLGYKDMADLWRSNYDMPADDFEKELDRIWAEIKPLYEQLHCYVRSQLNKKYGDDIVDLKKPIPAHLLGNMWAQSWINLIDMVGVKGASSVNMTSLLSSADYDPEKMVKTAENFFVSLGMPKLPKTFYERSLFTKPADRDVVCHASAWHIDAKDDVRIKMCIKIDEENFRTIHHELGHIYYYLAYKDKPVVFQNSANDGFHEALGDTIELSITGQYLEKIGLLKGGQKPTTNAEQTLLKMALGKLAFLPFGLMIDKYRWQVFDGRTKPADYNKDWWTLRTAYQGVAAPRERPDNAFDPGAKYHIPAYTPYSRYFLAHILQFQFHRSLCKTAGHTGPLHECSIFQSKEAGEKLWQMMKLGNSEPWPVALEKVTGSKTMDASAVRDYFAPLEVWLAQQNKGLTCGW